MNLGLYYKDKFENCSTEHQYNTRLSRNQKFLHPNVHSSKVFISFFHVALRFWNTILVTAKKLILGVSLKNILRTVCLDSARITAFD